jgi:predicted DNA-binding protein (MmcQ/YjbR family)
MNIDYIPKKLAELQAIENKISDSETVYSLKGVSFLLLQNSTVPKIHILCAPEFSNVLKEDFECVQPSSKMDSKQWIEVLLTGQLDEDQVTSLIDLSVEQSQSAQQL